MKALLQISFLKIILVPGARRFQRLWRLTDACGNTIFQTQVITIVDTTPPSFTTPEDITLGCETDVNDLTLAGTLINVGNECDPGNVQVSY